jgi:hypothetical protein
LVVPRHHRPRFARKGQALHPVVLKPGGELCSRHGATLRWLNTRGSGGPSSTRPGRASPPLGFRPRSRVLRGGIRPPPRAGRVPGPS